MGSRKNEERSEFSKSVRARAGEAMKEMEKMRELIMKELHEGFDIISNKVSSAAKSTSEMTGNLRNHVSEIHPREYWDKMVKEIEELRHELANGVSDRFNQLRQATQNAVARPDKKTRKKAATRKKTATKKGTKKKTTAKKSAKKKVTAKKSSKKTASKKAAKKKTSKKKAGKKKVGKKKPVKKKTGG